MLDSFLSASAVTIGWLVTACATIDTLHYASVDNSITVKTRCKKHADVHTHTHTSHTCKHWHARELQTTTKAVSPYIGALQCSVLVQTHTVYRPVGCANCFGFIYAHQCNTPRVIQPYSRHTYIWYRHFSEWPLLHSLTVQ